MKHYYTENVKGKLVYFGLSPVFPGSLQFCGVSWWGNVKIFLNELFRLKIFK